MKQYQSLSHTRWDYKYYVVFIPMRWKSRIFIYSPPVHMVYQTHLADSTA